MDKSPPVVFIVLGVYRPSARLLEQQLRSLRAQTYPRFRVLLVCDGPLADDAQPILDVKDDTRFTRLMFQDNVGVHANFARGLRAALEQSDHTHDLFAFCDQDDVWHPGKLAKQVELMQTQPHCGLCHCDARLVDAAGREVSPSMFAHEARSKRQGLLDLLVMNSVTGMTCVMRKDVAQAAAGFPMQDTPELLHDHWTSLVSAAQSEVVFLDLALVDYVQHAENVLGARHPAARSAFSSNLLLGGRPYWRRCKRQYIWRAAALDALEQMPDTSDAVRRADIRGAGGIVRLLAHLWQMWLANEHRQAAQTWRLLAGKFLSGLRRPSSRG